MVRFELKRLLRGSFVYGLGDVLQKFLSFLLLPLFTRFLRPEDYGIAALTALLSAAFTGLFSLGTGSSLGIIYFREENKNKRPAKIWTAFVLLLVWGTCLYALFFAVAPHLSTLIFQTNKHAYLLRIAMFGLLCSTIASPMLAYYRMEEKAGTYVVITLLSSLVSIGASIYLIVTLHLGVMGMLVAGVISNVCVLLGVLFIFSRNISFSIEPSQVKQLVKIGFPSIWGVFAFMIIDYADRQMIQRMLGLDALGIYSVGYSFGMMMLVCVNAFSLAWPPFFISFISRITEAEIVFGKVLKYYLMGFGLLVLGFFGLARPIIILMAATPYQDAYMVVGMVAAAYMLKGAYLIFLPGFYYSAKLVLQTTMEWIAALTNIALNVFLISWFGITGAAASTLGCYMVLTILTAVISRRYIKVKYEWSKVFLCITLLIGFSMVLYVASMVVVSQIDIIFINFAVIGIYLLVSVLWLLSKDERDLIQAQIKKIGWRVNES